ncbi:MAG TPA: hypothetical protein VFX49_10245 [Chloroflexota bacterium]|nr:hypothetical protein [Chloroflexota bacterium]
MPPRDRQAETDQHELSHGGQASGEVALGWPVDGDVGDVQCSVDERQDPEDEGEPRAQAGTQTWEGGDTREADGERYQRGEGVLACADPGLTVEERVVDRVQERERGRAAEGGSRPCMRKSTEKVVTRR